MSPPLPPLVQHYKITKLVLVGLVNWDQHTHRNSTPNNWNQTISHFVVKTRGNGQLYRKRRFSPWGGREIGGETNLNVWRLHSGRSLVLGLQLGDLGVSIEEFLVAGPVDRGWRWGVLFVHSLWKRQPKHKNAILFLKITSRKHAKPE